MQFTITLKVMKKYFPFILFLLFLLPSMAQDTVKWDDPWYLFNPRSERSNFLNTYYNPCTLSITDTGFIEQVGGLRVIQKYSNSKSEKVYGIAVTACFEEDDFVYNLYNQDYTGGKVKVDSVEPNNHNSKNCFFEYQVTHIGIENIINPPIKTAFSCLELYFEMPRLTTDTFWIELVMGKVIGYSSVYCCELDVFSDNIFLDVYAQNQPEFRLGKRNGLIFPIVELRCRGEAPVARVEETGSGWARVSWSPDYVEEDYQVGVGRYGTEPADSLTFEVRGDTTLTIAGLENGYPYAIWVRRGCRYAPGGYDTVVWGEWGRYASLYLPPDTTGILAADESGELKVYPNPAHGVLTVDLCEVSDDVAELTLSDLGGREVLRTKAERPLTKVDVGALPASLYLLQAASPGKVYRRRVAVE